MSESQQRAAKKHALHKQWQDDADRRLAEAIRENANDKDIVRGKLGRGLRKWADRVLVNAGGVPRPESAPTPKHSTREKL